MHTSSPGYRGVALLIYLLPILETELPHVRQASAIIELYLQSGVLFWYLSMQTQQRPCVPTSCHPNPNPQGSSDIRPSSSSWGLQSPPPPSSASQPQYDRCGLLNSRPLSLERGKRPCNSNVGTQAGPTLVFGLVVVAGLIGDAMLMGIGPHWKVIAAFTGASVATVDDILHRKQGGGPRAFPLDVDAVCNSQHAGQHHPVPPSSPPRPYHRALPPAPSLVQASAQLWLQGHALVFLGHRDTCVCQVSGGRARSQGATGWQQNHQCKEASEQLQTTRRRLAWASPGKMAA